MNKFCVIIASHIPSYDKIYIGEDLLTRVKLKIPDADIIVGINPSTIQDDWIKVVKKYTDLYDITPDHLVVPSDASAYQTGLRLYKENKKTYDAVWFLHTQGTRSELHWQRELNYTNLLGSIEHILNTLSFPSIGAFASCLAPGPWIDDVYPCNADKITDRFNKYDKFKYTNFRYLTLGAMYVVKGKILDQILEYTTDELLNGPLWVYENTDKTRGDRWFFERDFITFVYKLGYIVLTASLNNQYQIPMSVTWFDYYKEKVHDWILTNNFYGKI